MTTLPLVRTRHTQNTPIVQSGTHPETSTAYLMLPHPHTQAATQMAAVCAHTSMQCGQHRAAARYTRTASAPAPTPHTTAPHDRTRHTSMTCPDPPALSQPHTQTRHGQKRKKKVQGLASALTKAKWRAGIASSCCTMQEKTAQANDATQQQTNSSMLLQRATTHAYPQPYHTCTHSTAVLPTPYHTGN